MDRDDGERKKKKKKKKERKRTDGGERERNRNRNRNRNRERNRDRDRDRNRERDPNRPKKARKKRDSFKAELDAVVTADVLSAVTEIPIDDSDSGSSTTTVATSAGDESEQGVFGGLFGGTDRGDHLPQQASFTAEMDALSTMDVLGAVADIPVDDSDSGSSTSSEAIPIEQGHRASIPSNVESIHFEDDLLGAMADIESDGSDSGSSTAPWMKEESIPDLDALDGDVVNQLEDISSDESASSEGQEAALQEAAERQKKEEALKPKAKISKKKTVFDVLFGAEDNIKEDVLDTTFQVDEEESESSSDESYSFLVN